MSQRFEMRLSDDLAAAIDEARGDQPRATWIKKAIAVALAISGEGGALEKTLGEHATTAETPMATGVPGASGVAAPASPRAPKDQKLETAREVLDAVAPDPFDGKKPYQLPKIAPRRQA